MCCLLNVDGNILDDEKKSNVKNIDEDDLFSGHFRRYSAPWDSKRLENDNFGTNYDKMNDNYFKNSGNPNIGKNMLTLVQIDSSTLPFIRDDPCSSYLYSLSKLRHQKQDNNNVVSDGNKGIHVRSMSAIGLQCHYIFDEDFETPDLPVQSAVK